MFTRFLGMNILFCNINTLWMLHRRDPAGRVDACYFAQYTGWTTFFTRYEPIITFTHYKRTIGWRMLGTDPKKKSSEILLTFQLNLTQFNLFILDPATIYNVFLRGPRWKRSCLNFIYTGHRFYQCVDCSLWRSTLSISKKETD